MFGHSYHDEIVDIAPDPDLVKKFTVKTPFNKKCGVDSRPMAHSECNTDKKVTRSCVIRALWTNESLKYKFPVL